MRKLNYVHVDKSILTMFYRSIIESVITFCITFCHTTVSEKKKLNKIVKCARKLGCVNVNDLNSLYIKSMSTKMSKIMKNEDHPLCMYFKMLPSERRMSCFYSRTARFANTFVLSAIRNFNQ